jgi:2-keto-3-deoxy-galactonokinase
MTTDEPKERTKQFALRVMTLVEVDEEADESAFWLELIIGSEIRETRKIAPLLDEANELVAIMAASRKSAIANRPSAIR